MMLGYSLLLALALVLSAPWWGVRMLTTERYRKGLGERLGFVPRRLTEGMHGYGFRTRVVWVHAVSVGEVLAASRLVGELEAALGEGWGVVVSTTTKTGQALAKERFGTERVFYMPLDFAGAVRAYLRALQPAAVVLMESELWPRMLHECARAGVPVAVVNARVSDRSFARGMKVRAVWGWVLRRVSLWLAQSDEDARRLVAMGARAEAVKVGGNLKYDVRAPKVSRVAELIKEAAAGRSIVVAGSTLGENPPEDSPLIQAQQALSAADRPLLVLAPRHPENFDVIYSLAMEFPTLSATELIEGADPRQAHAVTMREQERAPVEIVILNTIGDLAAVYEVADVAFVGGSMIRRGGHNPLEPAQFGVPVIMGPSFENFRGIVTKMREADAISILPDIKGKLSSDDVSNEMAEALIDEVHLLLRDSQKAKAMGERGRKVFEEQQGATGRAVMAIVAMIQGAKP